jgi:hypothetical protein
MAQETTHARNGGSSGRALLAWVAILGLLGLVGWLAAERNARTWYLVPDEGRLVVMKGVLFPLGRQGFKTADPALAQAYAPLVAPPGKPLPAEQSYEERSLLDQGVYDLLAGWAREEIASGDPARMERGLGYLGRAERLAGISPAQREDLAALRAESGFHEARRLVERATQELRDAAEKLRVAAGSRSSHAMDAQVLLRDVEPAVDAAVSAMRAAGAAGRARTPEAKPAEAPVPAAPADGAR